MQGTIQLLLIGVSLAAMECRQLIVCATGKRRECLSRDSSSRVLNNMYRNLLSFVFRHQLQKKALPNQSRIIWLPVVFVFIKFIYIYILFTSYTYMNSYCSHHQRIFKIQTRTTPTISDVENRRERFSLSFTRDLD